VTHNEDAASGLGEGCGIDPIVQPLSADLRVWRVSLDAYPETGIHSGLAPDETARAARFVHPDDRRRFLAARHALRRILGACSGCDPAELAFAAGEFGKPGLAGGEGPEFNVTHSAGDCLIALSERQAVGVDVERLAPLHDIDALARLHFTALERAELARTDPQARVRAFLVGWTRKEACLKALGVGLAAQPASVEVGCEETIRDVVVVVAGVRCGIALASLSPGDGAVGAVALAHPEDVAKARHMLARSRG
jgi:4'-phosphopantetheinyl transferase